MSNEFSRDESSDLAWCLDCGTAVEELLSAPGCACRTNCWGCNRLTPRATLVTDSAGHACCPECTADGDEPSDGVPVAVEDDVSCAQTVRLAVDPSIRESGEAWAERLDSTREGAAA